MNWRVSGFVIITSPALVKSKGIWIYCLVNGKVAKLNYLKELAKFMLKGRFINAQATKSNKIGVSLKECILNLFIFMLFVTIRNS